jgi:hypothetical protein
MWLGLRTAAAVLFVVGVVWAAAGLAYSFAVEEQLTRAAVFDWGLWLLRGRVLGVFGALIGAALFIVAGERHWRSNLRRGTATLYNLRPGRLVAEAASQKLICELDVQVPGTAPIRADYRAEVGPLDAQRLVEGATFVCALNPALPGRVGVWLLQPPPPAGALTGRYVDFKPV